MIPEMFDKLIFWITERERIRQKKEQGLPPPWTDDPRMREFRFCNVRREDDAVTRWINQFIRIPYAHTHYLPVGLSLCRWINQPSTLRAIIDHGLWPADEFPNLRAIRDLLRELPPPVFRPAYIIPNLGIPTDKPEIVCSIAIQQVRDRIGECREHLTSVRKATTWFASLKGWGGFMSNQVVADLVHTPLMERAPDKMDYCAPGPGTRRGLKHLFGDWVPEEKEQKALRFVRQRINERIGIYLPLSDVGNICCEFDKWIRPNPPKQRYVSDKSIPKVH